MKRPREINTYCPHCEKHTAHEIEKVKKRQPSELKWGQRRFRKITAGYGGFPRAKPHGEKPTRRVSILYRCKDCKKAQQRACIRAKKFELGEK
jgi:large subunit ribosomal protein L44e